MGKSAGPSFHGDVHRSRIPASLLGEPVFSGSSPFSILESPCCKADWNSGALNLSCFSNCPLLLHITKARSSSSLCLCLETKANWGIKSSAPTLGVNDGGFCHSQALYLQDGLKLGNVHLVPDPGMPGWGISTASWGCRVEGASGNGKDPDLGVTETQVTCETASKFCHLSEPPYLEKGILKHILRRFDEIVDYVPLPGTQHSGRLLALLGLQLRAGLSGQPI